MMMLLLLCGSRPDHSSSSVDSAGFETGAHGTLAKVSFEVEHMGRDEWDTVQPNILGSAAQLRVQQLQLDGY